MGWLWLWPSGFSGASTAEEVTAGIDARGLVAVITGASSGIGLETARVLALRGVHVVMAVRNVAAGRNASEAIRAEILGAIVHVLEMDLSSMDSVRSNNAGIKAWGCTRSVDGLELHFATNYIGHFLLTNLLMENMKSTSSESGVEGRIVNVSFSGIFAYPQSKLASILHSTELARILKGEGDGVNISANAINPGVVETKMLTHNNIANALVFPIGRIGAATTCYVALHPQVKGISGKYFSNCNLDSPSSHDSNAELAKKLWEFSSKH
uniref:Uncharacterized protein n=1 Tax=Oryza nivara TaxID=4536 RepID=A0A0E0IW15_ORYNI